MPWIISFQVQGEDFRPSQVPFNFTEQHDPGVIGIIGRYRGQPVPYGSASYVVPPAVRNADMIRHIVETVEPVLPAIREAGASTWYVSIDRYYFAQCNEEYSLEELLSAVSQSVPPRVEMKGFKMYHPPGGQRAAH